MECKMDQVAEPKIESIDSPNKKRKTIGQNVRTAGGTSQDQQQGVETDKDKRKRHHHTPLEIEIRVQQLHELNYSYTSIRSTVEKATGYKISNGTIGRIINKRGKKREFGPDYKRSGRPTRRNQELIQQVASMVTDSESPLTQREISKKLNLSKTTINRIIRDDLPKLDQSTLGASKPLDRETIRARAIQQNEAILQTAASILASNEPLTQRAIAKRMNVSNSNINRIINQYLPTLKDAMKARKSVSSNKDSPSKTANRATEPPQG